MTRAISRVRWLWRVRCVLMSARRLASASALVTLAALTASSCRVEVGAPQAEQQSAGPVEIWVYTSMYQEVIDELSEMIARDLPDVTVQWYQAGSEKVAQRWEAEHAAGGSRACLIATSAPGWYLDLSERELLREYVSPRALELPRAWVTPTWAAIRVSLMVLASADPEASAAGAEASAAGAEGAAAGLPASFADLAQPAWRDRFSTGDPLSSGTNFATLSAWIERYGWAWLEDLQQNGWIAAGGNSAVMARMDSGERPVGVILLENLLAKPGVARTILPADGAIPVLGPLAIPTDCPTPDAAEKLYDWLLGRAAQEAIVRGHMHSPLPDIAPPAGAPPLAEIELMELPADFISRMARQAEDRKQRFQTLRRTGTAPDQGRP